MKHWKLTVHLLMLIGMLGGLEGATDVEDPLVRMKAFELSHALEIVRIKKAGDSVPDTAAGVIFENMELEALPSSDLQAKGIALVYFRGGRVTFTSRLIEQLISYPQLRYLAFDGAKLDGDLKLLGGLSGCLKLLVVRLAGTSVASFPNELGDLLQLEGLVLTRNPISRFPASVLRLTRLKALSLAGNELERLDQDIDVLADLEFFDASDNQIKQAEIKWPAKLQVVDLSRNKLGKVPGALRDLARLRQLILFDNYLAAIQREELPIGPLSLSVSSYTAVILSAAETSVNVRKIK